MSEGPTEPSSLRETTESLSQFGARVLNQLSITAWLPAAALVLCVAFILDLGGAIDARVTVPAANGAGGRGARAHPGIADPLTAALHTLSGVGLGGALLLIAAMTVLTMLTQAFAFEAIRVLEGYWGTGRLAESWAARRSATFREHRQDLDDLKVTLQTRAWHAARIRIEQTQAEDIRLNDDSEARTWTPDMLAVLGASLTGQKTDVDMPFEQRLECYKIPWEEYAPPDLRRQMINADKAIRDLPQVARAQPTRLGNVLRAYEDATRREHVETLVLNVYDQMTPGAQSRHNESRNRLDLYCSMVFVLLLLAAITWARLGWNHAGWAATMSVALLGLAWLMYRAAIASARGYSLILVRIAQEFLGT